MAKAADSQPRDGRGRVFFTALAACLLSLMALVAGLSSIRSWDIWWHLRTGDLALARRSTLPVDEFSLTHSGADWVYKDLGADIVLHLFYALGGEAGLVVFKALAALGVLGLLGLLARQRKASAVLAVAVVGFAFLISSFRIIARPEAFTLLCFPVLLLLLERRRSGGVAGAAERWPLVAAVALLWVWANLHRGVVLGVALMWGYALYELLGSTLPSSSALRARAFRVVSALKDQPFRKALWAVGCAAVGTGIIILNPSGTRIVSQAVQVTTSQELARVISEWQTLSFGELWQAFPLSVIWMAITVPVVAITFAVSMRRDGRIDLWDLGLTAFTVALAFKAPRMLPLMAIATAPVLSEALEFWLQRPLKWAAVRASWAAVFVAAAVWLSGWSLGGLDLPEPGFAEDWYPEAAVAIIEDEPIAGEGFTTFIYAGYMIFHAWPEKHVMCDGRNDTVYPIDALVTCIEAQNDPDKFQAFVDQYDLQWVLAHNRPPRNRGALLSFAFLARDPRWTLVHWDTASLLYVRASGPNAPLAERLGYRLLRPHDPDVSLMEAVERSHSDPVVREHLDAEVRRLERAATNDYRTYVVLALYLHETGQNDSEEMRAVIDALRNLRDVDPISIDEVLTWVGG